MEKHALETTKYRVQLSPEYDDLCRDWDLETCRRMALYFSQFAHQLEMRVRIADADREYRRPGKHPLRCVVPGAVRASN